MEHFNRKQERYDASEIFQQETFTDLKPRTKPSLNHSKTTMPQGYPRYPREKPLIYPYMSEIGRRHPYQCDSPTRDHRDPSEGTRVLPIIDDKYQDTRADHISQLECMHLPPILPNGRYLINQVSTFSTTPTSSKAMRRADHISRKKVLQSTYCYSPQKPNVDSVRHRGRTEGNGDVPKNLLSCRDMEKLKSGTVRYNNILPPIGETYQVRTDYYRGVLCKSDSDSSGSMVSSDSIDLDLNSTSEWVGDFFESMRKYFINCDENLSYFLSRYGNKRRDAVCEELDRFDATGGLADLVRQHVITEMLSLYF